MYKLTDTNGKVKFLLRSGRDFVQNEMPLSEAQNIIRTGEVSVIDRPDYPIVVDNTWFFEGKKIATVSKTTSRKKETKV